MNKRETDKKVKERNAKSALEGIKGNVGDVSHNIDLLNAANRQESQEHNNNNYELCVDRNDIAKKGAFIMPNIDIENNVEQDRWDYHNEYNKWERGGNQKQWQTKTEQNLRELCLLWQN